MNARPGRPSTASVSPARSSASSGARPTNVVLVTREATTTPVSRSPPPERGDSFPAAVTAVRDTPTIVARLSAPASGGWSRLRGQCLHALATPYGWLMEAPYGSWPSPIDGDVVARDPGWTHSLVLTDGDSVCWSEARSLEGGRDVVVTRRPDGTRADAIPAGVSARTRVHEYGGGAYTVHAGTVYFCSDADQRIYAMRDGVPVPITPEPEVEHGLRYADLQLAGDVLICVRERVAEPEHVNELVAIPLDGGDARPRGGPRLLRRAARLARREAPRLAVLGPPADALGGLGAPGRGPCAEGDAQRRAAGRRRLCRGDRATPVESRRRAALQLGPDRLVEPLPRDSTASPMEAEVGGPMWVFGESCYGFLPTAGSSHLQRRRRSPRGDRARRGAARRTLEFTRIVDLTTDGSVRCSSAPPPRAAERGGRSTWRPARRSR